MGTEITRYEPPSQIARFRPSASTPEPVYSGWKNFVSQQSVRLIAVAPKSNYLWLATWGGVIAYPQDDISYKRYTSEHGLAGNEIACLCLDESENPWVGHSEGGLSYFDGQKWQVYQQLREEPIRVLANAGSGKGIWVATQEIVYRVSGFNQAPIPVPTMSENGTVETLCLLADEDKLFIGNPWGLFLASENQVPQAIAGIESCTALTKDKKGKICIGTPSGLFVLVNNKVNKYSDFNERVLALTVKEELLWVLTVSGLFQILDGRFSQVEIPEITIRSIAASSRDNSLWIGTDKSLAKLETNNLNQFSWELELLNAHPDDKLINFGRCILCQNSECNEKVWVGTVGGLFTYESNKQNSEWSQIYSTNNKDFRALVIDVNNSNQLWMLNRPNGVEKFLLNSFRIESFREVRLPLLLAKSYDGYLYILTEKALLPLETMTVTELLVAKSLYDHPSIPIEKALQQLKANTVNKTFVKLPPRTQCLQQTPDGIWWLGTGEGLYKLTNGKWQFVGEQPSPLQASVYAMLVIKDTLCAATENGLWTLAPNGWIQHKLQISHARVWTLAASRQDTLWLASEDGVINYNPFTYSINKLYNCINSGLASRRVTALLETSEALWIITQFGINRVSLI